MQEIHIQNNLFSPKNLKYVEINNYSVSGIRQKNFIYGLRNARNILDSLGRSLCKSSKYEMKLLQCRETHIHSHENQECWDSDVSENKPFNCSNKGTTTKSSRNQAILADSWSTMSIVCLQYQYEELSKRYESLLQAYDESCSAVNARDISIVRLRQRMKYAHAQLAHAHKALLSVGNKYLALRRKRNAQVNSYEEEIAYMKKKIRDVIAAAENARLEFDVQLSRSMVVERDSNFALLLSEIRKCNFLFLENLQLKVLIDEIAPGCVDWDK